MVSTTWFTDSAFGRLPELHRAVVNALPAQRFAVAAVLHPNVWAVHGRRQVTAWLAGAVADGLLLDPARVRVAGDDARRGLGDRRPRFDHWLRGRDGMSGDARVPVGGQPQEGSVADVVRAHTLPLDWARPLPGQAEAAWSRVGGLAVAVTEAITSRPDRSAELLRAQMYRLLELSAPAAPAVLPLLPVPRPLPGWAA